jgi:hypothetical protein
VGGGTRQQQVYAHVKRLHRAHPDADGITIQGSAWRCESIVATLEQDLQTPWSTRASRGRGRFRSG